MKDFFISYNNADREWAEWIAWQLEEAGFSVILQAWDFLVGSNFVDKMHHATSEANRIIAVISNNYLNAHYTRAEWQAAFARDPTSVNRTLIPILVDDCKLDGLLSQIVHIDLANIKDAKKAKDKLLTCIMRERYKPEFEPDFPLPSYPGALPQFWNVPHNRNANFTGREVILNDLRSALESEHQKVKTIAIHGLGGVGKTQLALEYLYCHKVYYEIVWWIRSEDPITLESDFASLASALNLPEKDALEQDIIVKAVRSWLGQNDKWLLVFDNVANPIDIYNYLPQGQTGHVIITSRNPNWEGMAYPLPVKELNRDESLEFLCTRVRQNDKARAYELAEELGDLPLALEQAGAYIETVGKTIADYLTLFRQRRQELLTLGKQSTGYPHTVATTWNLAFEQVEQASPIAAAILNLCAFFASDDIPRTLFSTKQENMPTQLASAFENPLKLDEAIIELRKYSLLDTKPDTLSVHRLVQAVTHDRLPVIDKKKWAKAALNMIYNIFPSDSYDVRYWPECISLMSHAQAAISNISKSENYSEKSAMLLNRMALYMRSRAEYAGAYPMFTRALRIYEEKCGKDNQYVAMILNNLALLLQDQGKYADAEPLHRKALMIYESKLGNEHTYVAMSMNNLASLLKDQAKFAEAEKYYRSALKIYEDRLGKTHPNAAKILNNLGSLFKAQGKYKEAELLIRKALLIFKKHLGRDHPYYATCMHNLARIFHANGKYAKAERLFRRALEIRESHLGKNHPEVATSMHNLASLLKDMDKYDEAKALFNRALEIREKQLGKNHPEVATSLCKLASLLKDQNMESEAAVHFRRAFEIRKQMLGNDNPLTQQVRKILDSLKE